MLYSVNELMKKIDSIQSDIDSIKTDIRNYETFYVSSDETIEEAKPDFDVLKAFETMEALTIKKGKIRNLINNFNTNTKIEGLEITIAEALYLLPQFNNQLSLISELGSRKQESRKLSVYGSCTDTEYANYDVKKAKEKAKMIEEKIDKIHLGIDEMNTKKLIEL